MSQLTVDQVIQLALDHHKSGEIDQAEALFHQILDVYPDQADALHLLGALYLQSKRLDLAEARVRQAILNRHEPGFKLTLGLILQATQRLDEAVLLYNSLVGEHPDLIEPYIHLGVVLSMQYKFEQAAAVFQQAVQRAPGHAVAQGNLGIVLCHLKRWDEAIWILREAVVRDPKNADFHSALGASLYFKHQYEPALAECRQAIALNPNIGQAHNVLSSILRDMQSAGLVDPAASANVKKESLEAARTAAMLLPDHADAHLHYGEALRAEEQLDQAAAHYRKAVAHLPHSADLHNNLGNVLKDQGQLDEAIAEYRLAADLFPTPAHYSNLIYTLHYHPAYNNELLFEELQSYNTRFIEPLKGEIRPLGAIDRNPNRRLRIGYISAEFRQHALGLNILPLLSRHDKSQFEIFCYADVAKPDYFTFQLRQCADHWQEINALSDAAVAELVRRDQIDILIDLHQHIAGNKLPLYARKPAPIQIAFAGYPGSSGLSTMDYRLTDPYLEPPELPQVASPEIALRLPATFWCYHPALETPVNELPASNAGAGFTFGNLNNFCKLNEGTYTLWAQIMLAVKNSQLLLLAPEGSHRARTRAFFQARGIQGDRIRFIGRQSAGNYYKLYHQIDLSLDSFPCNGHTTSMDSFFMGVPVTTIIGDRLFGRATWSQLNNLGLPELAAKTEAEFVAISIALAHDLPRLAQFRRTLRDRMKSSPLMNDAAFAKGIESAYRQAWHNYCNAAPTGA